MFWTFLTNISLHASLFETEKFTKCIQMYAHLLEKAKASKQKQNEEESLVVYDLIQEQNGVANRKHLEWHDDWKM